MLNPSEVKCFVPSSAVFQAIGNQKHLQAAEATVSTKSPQIESALHLGTENYAPPTPTSASLSGANSNSSLVLSSHTSSSSVEIWCTPILPRRRAKAQHVPNQRDAIRDVKHASEDEADSETDGGTDDGSDVSAVTDGNDNEDALRVQGGTLEPLGIPAPATYADATNLAEQFPHIAEHILALPLENPGNEPNLNAQAPRGVSSGGNLSISEANADARKDDTSTTTSAAAHTASQPNWALAPSPDLRSKGPSGRGRGRGRGRDKATDGGGRHKAHAGDDSNTKEHKSDQDGDGQSGRDHAGRRRKRGRGGSRKRNHPNAPGENAGDVPAGIQTSSGSSTPARLPGRPTNDLRHPLPARPPAVDFSPGSRAGTPGYATVQVPLSTGTLRMPSPGRPNMNAHMGANANPTMNANMGMGMNTNMNMNAHASSGMPLGTGPRVGVGAGFGGFAGPAAAPPRDLQAEVDSLIIELQSARYGLGAGGNARPGMPVPMPMQMPVPMVVQPPQSMYGPGFNPAGSMHSASATPTRHGHGLGRGAYPRAPPTPNNTPTASSSETTGRSGPNEFRGRGRGRGQPKIKWLRDHKGVLRPDLHLDTGAVHAELRLAGRSQSEASSPVSARSAGSGAGVPSGLGRKQSFYASNIKAGQGQGQSGGVETQKRGADDRSTPTPTPAKSSARGNPQAKRDAEALAACELSAPAANGSTVSGEAKTTPGNDGQDAPCTPKRPRASTTVSAPSVPQVHIEASGPRGAGGRDTRGDAGQDWPTLDQICAMKMTPQKSL